MPTLACSYADMPTVAVQLMDALNDAKDRLALIALEDLAANMAADRRRFLDFISANADLAGQPFVATFTSGGNTGARWQLFLNFYGHTRRLGMPTVCFTTDPETQQARVNTPPQEPASEPTPKRRLRRTCSKPCAGARIPRTFWRKAALHGLCIIFLTIGAITNHGWIRAAAAACHTAAWVIGV